MIYYIYADDALSFMQEAKVFMKEEITALSFSQMHSFDLRHASHLLVTGSLDKIKEILTFAEENDISIGIIPTSEQKELIGTFSLPDTLEDAVTLALTPSEKPIDLLYANETLVLHEVIISNVTSNDSFDSALNTKSYFEKIKIFFNILKTVRYLKHIQMKITDAKENVVKLSTFMVIAVKYNHNSFTSKIMASQLSATDGKLSIVILSPTSIVQYLGYVFKSLFLHLTPRIFSRTSGLMQSSRMVIETKEPVGILLDFVASSESIVSLEVKEKALSLSVGEAFWEDQPAQNTSKDSIKIDNLPVDDENISYLSKSIPLFSHATTEQYASLFTNLREESRLSKNFMVLLILATMLATFGLFINSSSIIIGAMLLAPLMQPIVSLSMGVLRQDVSLEIQGSKTLAIGVFTVLVTAAIIAMLIPIEQLTTQMHARLSPTILDLIVAIVSGTAAAYAKSNEKILSSLAGVAIAVALVPPIAVAGIGLGWMNFHMFYTAFLLFITNLVGIVFAAAFTFALLGFSPFKLAKRGITIWLLIVAVVAIPLYSSFSKMKTDIYIQKTLSNLSFNVGEHDIKLTHIEVIHRLKKNEIRCEVISSGMLNAEEKARLKEAILKSVDMVADVIVTFRYKL